MKKYLLMALVVALIGTAGCSGGGDKAKAGDNTPATDKKQSADNANGTNAGGPANTDTSKPVGTGPDANGTKTLDMSKPADTGKSGDKVKASEPNKPAGGGTKIASGKGGFVGRYGLDITPEQQKMMDAQMEAAKAQLAKMPADQRAKAEKSMQDGLAAVKRMEFVINADGTFKVVGLPGGKTIGGKYTVDGNTLTLTATEGVPPTAQKPQTLVYDDKTHTLKDAKSPMGMVMKKK